MLGGVEREHKINPVTGKIWGRADHVTAKVRAVPAVLLVSAVTHCAYMCCVFMVATELAACSYLRDRNKMSKIKMKSFFGIFLPLAKLFFQHAGEVISCGERWQSLSCS